MTLLGLLLYLLFATTLFCAVYLLFSKNLYRISFALFVLNVSLSGIMLYLGYRAISLIFFSWSAIATVLFLSFSSALVGDLSNGFQKSEGTKKFANYIGLFVGGGFGFGFLWAIKRQGLALDRSSFDPGIPMEALGKQLLGEHSIVLHLIGFLILIVVIGASTLRRRIDGQRSSNES
ncbi:MAG TPA: NADH-quinone oxidoreductase subunit J [Oligoflexia bacterium]|nr:NADH-quinone oxidoreductase subunit J [Oligoflexia bacterium]